MKEIWRDIKDYEGLYQVSNLGRVRSLDHYVKYKGNSIRLVQGTIMKLKLNRYGYLEVSLCKNGKHKSYIIHRLVAMTFPDLVNWIEEAKGKPFNKIDVNHKDENKLNNCVTNLEWCTKGYNIRYGTGIKRRSVTQKKTMPTIKPVLQYTLDMVLIKEYPSIREAERQTGIYNQNIIRCCKGKVKSAGGYIWRYKD